MASPQASSKASAASGETDPAARDSKPNRQCQQGTHHGEGQCPLARRNQVFDQILRALTYTVIGVGFAAMTAVIPVAAFEG